MFYTEDNNIIMTKGDSGVLCVRLANRDGSEYIQNEGDRVIFSLKKRKDAHFPVLLEKEGTNIVFSKEDTEKIPSGTYVYDVVIVRSAGERYTAIWGDFEIRKAVHEFE